MNKNMPQIETASVKVMRSFDYCHFEVCLGSAGPTSTEDVDALRKTAARLADKAVEQYRIAKADANKRSLEDYNHSILKEKINLIRKMPETDRTVGQQAELKAFDDKVGEASRPYDYEDEWENDQF